MASAATHTNTHTHIHSERGERKGADQCRGFKRAGSVPFTFYRTISDDPKLQSKMMKSSRARLHTHTCVIAASSISNGIWQWRVHHVIIVAYIQVVHKNKVGYAKDTWTTKRITAKTKCYWVGIGHWKWCGVTRASANRVLCYPSAAEILRFYIFLLFNSIATVRCCADHRFFFCSVLFFSHYAGAQIILFGQGLVKYSTSILWPNGAKIWAKHAAKNVEVAADATEQYWSLDVRWRHCRLARRPSCRMWPRFVC